MSTEEKGTGPSKKSGPAVASVRTCSIPPGVTATIEGTSLRVQGPQGTVQRSFPVDMLRVEILPGELRLSLRVPSGRRRMQALLATWNAHIRNMIVGVTVGFEAKLKSVTAHFPMRLQVKEGKLVIENFLGEKYPRLSPLRSDVVVSVEGEHLLVRGADIEGVGQCAATIERTTRIRNYDPRVFQDGIYLVEAAHPREKQP